MSESMENIRRMKRIQDGMLPVGVKEEVLNALIDLDNRIKKLEKKRGKKK